MKHEPVLDRAQQAQADIRRIRRESAQAMTQARLAGDNEAWGRIFTEAAWAIDDVNKAFWA